jgi:diaminopimelate epimerase
MKQDFYKYQGTGNDFVIIDNRKQIFENDNVKLIAQLCDRRFGVGADGLILLGNHQTADFNMIYFNADGNESSMCGNGGRCLVAFAKYLNIIKSEATFEAIDGMHHAFIENDIVKLQMQNVSDLQRNDDYVFLDTGSPHHVEFNNNLKQLDVKHTGEKIRYSTPYIEAGTNVNFVKKINDEIFAVRTYERGVEDETLSCGTGVTAVAIAMSYIGETEKNLLTIRTEGGDLQVSFQKNSNEFDNVWLIGPATLVFKGEIVW